MSRSMEFDMMVASIIKAAGTAGITDIDIQKSLRNQGMERHIRTVHDSIRRLRTHLGELMDGWMLPSARPEDGGKWRYIITNDPEVAREWEGFMSGHIDTRLDTVRSHFERKLALSISSGNATASQVAQAEIGLEMIRTAEKMLAFLK